MTVVSLTNVMVNETTGKYFDEHVMAFLNGEESAYPRPPGSPGANPGV